MFQSNVKQSVANILHMHTVHLLQGAFVHRPYHLPFHHLQYSTTECAKRLGNEAKFAQCLPPPSSAGIVFYYGIFQLAVWWFCHVVSLFWKIRFPFHARSFETAHRIKYIHITMVIVGLVLPTLPVIVAFTAGNPSTRGFRLTRFLCTSLQRDPTFYSLVLPINIVLAIGVPLLIILFWIIHKVYTFILNVQL